MSDEPSPAEAGTAPRDIGVMLHSRGYLRLLLAAALIGIPLSLVAFGFLAAVHQLEHLVWTTLPADLGFDGAPPWWPIVTLGLAAVLVAQAVTHLPGGGGHVPAMGMVAGATPSSYLPGVVLASAASLVLGAVIGPEAPLIALGSGLALLMLSRTKAAGDPSASAVISGSGSAAAISAIFGNPLVAAVMFLEVAGLARRRTMLIILPCLVASGVGALVFTGLGNWTGLDIGALTIPSLKPAHLELADLLWTLPMAAVVAFFVWAVFLLGNKTASLATSRRMTTTIAAALVTGASAAVYALVTGHSSSEVALSGQAMLAPLATHPAEWSTGALVMLLACKGLAYAVCLGAFRGGAVFPAVFLGAAFGVLASMVVPGVALVPGLAIGMAAGTTVTRMPVTGIVLVVLLMGDAVSDQMPVVILATVTALVVEELLSTLHRPADSPAAA